MTTDNQETRAAVNHYIRQQLASRGATVHTHLDRNKQEADARLLQEEVSRPGSGVTQQGRRKFTTA